MSFKAFNDRDPRISAQEFKTLELVKKRYEDRTLPSFSQTTLNVFKSFDESANAPQLSTMDKQHRILDRNGIENLINKVEHGKKHKILSLLTLAGAVALAAAVVIPLAILSLPTVVFTITFFAFPLIAGSLAYVSNAFNQKTLLEQQTNRIIEVQQEAEELKQFMDSNGSQLIKTLESTIALLNPTTPEAFKEKSNMETALFNLHLAAQFVAELAEVDAEG